VERQGLASAGENEELQGRELLLVRIGSGWAYVRGGNQQGAIGKEWWKWLGIDIRR
jgi:hypothetical protein